MEFIGLQKVSLVDFDNKVCCTLFTGGCNFRCPFCHNSELVLMGEATRPYTMEEILSYLNTRKGLLDAVCITGGEPTLMKDLKDKIIKIKELGFLIKLDTNGTNPDVLIDLVESKLVDYVAMDIKNDPKHYAETCGLKELDLTNISKSIKYLLENHVDYEFRTTLVKEFHTVDNIKAIAPYLSGAKRYFLQHFVDNNHCLKNGLHDVSQDEALRFKNILLPYVNEVKLRGYEIK